MSDSTTNGDDLASTSNVTVDGNDQAGTGSQENWKARYDGIKGKLVQVTNEYDRKLADIQREKAELDALKAELEKEISITRESLKSAEGDLATVSSDREKLSEQLNVKQTEVETMAQALAKQGLLLEFPSLVSDPVAKLVNSSNMSVDELRDVLSGMSESQKDTINRVYKDAQAGSTDPVSPATAKGNPLQEQIDAAWNKVQDLTGKAGPEFTEAYREYIRLKDSTGDSPLKTPIVLSKPI